MADFGSDSVPISSLSVLSYVSFCSVAEALKKRFYLFADNIVLRDSLLRS